MTKKEVRISREIRGILFKFYPFKDLNIKAAAILTNRLLEKYDSTPFCPDCLVTRDACKCKTAVY